MKGINLLFFSSLICQTSSIKQEKKNIPGFLNNGPTKKLKDNLVDLLWNQQYGNGRGGFDINWNPFGNATSYKAYRSQDHGEFKAVSSMDLTQDKVRVINIYPVINENMTGIPIVNFTYEDGSSEFREKSASAKVWIEGGWINGKRYDGVGKIDNEQKIFVDLIPSPEFNINPDLVDGYDVIFYGTWDGNYGASSQNPKDNQASDIAVNKIKQFVDQGGGLFAGHDTVVAWAPFAKLGKDYFGLTFVGDWYYSSYAMIRKAGFLTNYPHNLGPVGTILQVSYTHTYSQKALPNTTVWMTLGNDEALEVETHIFLTSYKNVAFSQTGHSNCESTLEERKIIANTLFSMKQKLTATHFIDQTAWDYTNPKAPNANVLKIDRHKKEVELQIQPEDIGTQYIYKIIESSGEEIQTTTPIEVKSGINQTCFLLDEDPSTKIHYPLNCYNCKPKEESFRVSLQIKNNIEYYFHAASIDNSENIGETATIKVGPINPSKPFSKKVKKTIKSFRKHRQMTSIRICSVWFLCLFP